jgi:hypothetical protein
MSLLSDAENAASQSVNDVDTAPVIGLATVPGADERIKLKVDDEAHGVQDTIEGVRDGTRSVDNDQVIDGAHVILN